MKRTPAQRLLDEMKNKTKTKAIDAFLGKKAEDDKPKPKKAKSKKSKPSKAKKPRKTKEVAVKEDKFRDIQMERLLATRKDNPAKLTKMFDKVTIRATNSGKKQRKEPTPTLIAAVCNVIKTASVSVDVALRSLGVSILTAQDWVTRGVADLDRGLEDTMCARLVTSLDIAMAQDEIMLATQVKEGFGRWQRVAYVIERRYGQRWGRDAGQQDALSLARVQTVAPTADITPDTAAEVMAILEEHGMLVSADANPGEEIIGVDLTSADGGAPIRAEEMQEAAFNDPGQETEALVIQPPQPKVYDSPVAALKAHAEQEKKLNEGAVSPGDEETEEQRRERLQRAISDTNGFDW